MARIGNVINQYTPGVPTGMNTALPAHVIADNEASYMQDILINTPGLTNRRGPSKPVIVNPTSFCFQVPDKLVGICQATTPDGITRAAFVRRDTATNFLYFDIMNDDYVLSTTTLILNNSYLSTDPYPIFDAKPASNGATMIGITSDYENPAARRQALFMWHGANNGTYFTGTAGSDPAYTVANQPNYNIVGVGTTWTSAMVGMFFLTTGVSVTPIGVVTKVIDATHLVLDTPAVFAAGTGYTMQSVRTIYPNVQTGLLTTSTGSAGVTGGNTKFLQQFVGLSAGGVWSLYRLSDRKLIGTVSTVQNDTGLTLTAPASVAMSQEAYVAYPTPGSGGLFFPSSASAVLKMLPGVLNATYAGKQFYGNLGAAADSSGTFIDRVMYTGNSDPENIDFSSTTGDFIIIPSSNGSYSPLKAIVPASDSVLFIKETEVWQLTGTDDDSFSPHKISEYGTICGMSAVAYNGNVIWAGKDGVYAFDSTQVTNISQDKLGDFYKSAIASFNPLTKRMWATIYRDHYILQIEVVNPNVSPIKGTTIQPQSNLTFVCYLPTGTWTTFSNFSFRGAVNAKINGVQSSWYIDHYSASTDLIGDFATVFDTTGNDYNTLGPDLYLETKKYSFDSANQQQLWKFIKLNVKSQADGLKIDVVPGLDTSGRNIGSIGFTNLRWSDITDATWAAFAAHYLTWDAIPSDRYATKKIRFFRDSTHVSFRIYQNSFSVLNTKIGAITIGASSKTGLF